MVHRLSPFGRTRALQGQIDEFLDAVSRGGLIFQRGLRACIERRLEIAEQKLVQITELEHHADDLRRSTETTLYAEMLIPESRGDVLNLLGDLDDLLDGFKSSLMGFVVERPDVPDAFRSGVIDLGAIVTESCEQTVQAARAFFRDAPNIRDHIHKIGHYEAESDEVTLRLRKAIFAHDMPLAQKLHLRGHIQGISQIADAAEDCGDRLTIYAIKRSL